jgi:hypothetical protein
MANSAIPITDLDFDGIKASLKAYLESQDEFADYDFEGGGLNMLLDILSYNTHYTAYMANMQANEMFLDSAALRSSVVSHAKHIGYTPRSYRAATATVNFSGLSSNLSKSESVTATVDGTDYNFHPDQDYTHSGGVINNVVLLEGKYLTFSFIVDTQDAEQRFVIPNNTIDTSTLVVKVQNSF